MIPDSKGDRTTPKKCPRCRRPGLMRSDFHRNGTQKDGRQRWCRRCMNRVMLRVSRKNAADLRAFRLLKTMIAVAEQESGR